MSKVVKVPIILQMEEVECGAASLAMILAYYGRWVPLETIRKDCGVSRDGSSAKSIMLAAQLYGLNVEAYSVGLDALKEMTPCICYWEFDHFLVFKGFRGGQAYLNDPATGEIRVSMKEFSRKFTGVAIEFSPSPDFKKGGRKPSMAEYIKNGIDGSGSAMLITLLLGIFGAFVTAALPIFSQIFTDHILTGEHTNWLKVFIPILLAFALFSFVQVYFNRRYSKRIAGSLALKSNSRFINHILNLPMEFFSQRSIGDLLDRFRSNESVTNTMVNVLAPLAIDIGLIVLYVAMMLIYSIPLAIIGIVTAIINIIILVSFANKRENLAKTLYRCSGKYYGATISCIDNIESIKAAGAERSFFAYWSGLFADTINHETEMDSQTSWINAIPQLLNSLSSAAVLIVGSYLIMKGDVSIGMLMAFQGYFAAFMNPIISILCGGENLIEMRAQMERIEDVMKYPEDKKSSSTDIGDGKLKGEVELRNVKFGYSPSFPVIEDFNLKIQSGKSIALVGASGCGKSTISKLLSGLYHPWEGEILYDGKPIESIPSEVFTNSVAVIDQNIILFDDTIADNVRMWDSSVEDFALTMACEDACIRKDIMLRKEGMATKIVKGGANFSGGQRQRIEIATALAREPAVLIMDEATSALDPTTEKQVMQKIRESGVSLVIVAHRLSTIRDCDEIIVMDKGRVVQRGTHENLIAQPGLYKNLMQSI